MRYLLFMIVLLAVACKTDTPVKSSNNSTDTKQVPTAQNSDSKSTPQTKEKASTLRTKDGKSKSGETAETNYNSEGIPDACDLLSKETIAKYVNQPVGNIFLADGSSPQNPKSRACFFKWDGSAIANAGVMVQLQRNPVQEDVPEYFTYLIASKKTEGEVDPATKSVMKYNDWPGFGDDGAYSTDAGKYSWRVGNDWAFTVAFNTELPPKSQKAAAHAFAQEVMTKMPF